MTDYSPLHDGNPFLADHETVHQYGTEVAETGALIANSVRLLRRAADEDNWSTDTADAFRERAEDLADEIDKSRGRYEDVGGRLKQVAWTFKGHADEGARLARLAREQEAEAGGDEVQPTRGEDGLPEPLSDADRAANGRRQDAIDEIDRLRGLFETEVADARSAAEDAAGDIEGYLDDDVKDSWWDSNAGWLKIVKTVLTVIIVIAAIVILTVATGGTIWIIAVAVSVAAGLISLGISIGLAQSGNGSWWDVAFDVVGLLTLGMGGLLTKLASKGMPALVRGFSTFKGAAAYDDAFSGMRLTMGNLLSSAPFQFMRTAGANMLGRLGDDAMDAMNAARTAAEAMPDVSRLSAFLNGGREGAEQSAQARNILNQLTNGNVPANLANMAAGLTSEATSIARLADGANRLANLGSLSSLVSAGHEVADGGGFNSEGVDPDGFDITDPDEILSIPPIIIDIVGGLR